MGQKAVWGLASSYSSSTSAGIKSVLGMGTLRGQVDWIRKGTLYDQSKLSQINPITLGPNFMGIIPAFLIAQVDNIL